MRAWVTGASGQIGLELCRQLQLDGHEVVGLGRGLDQPGPWDLWIDWDLLRTENPAGHLEPPDWLFHLAGQTSSYTARMTPLLDVQINVLGFVRLLESIRDMKFKTFVVAAGSATEFSSYESSWINEKQPLKPTTFYDVAKATQRLYLEQFIREGWIGGSQLHLSNIYGGKSQQNTERGFLNRVIASALRGEPLTHYGHGNYVRDFVHVQDCASAFIACASHTTLTDGESFLIGTGCGTSIREVLDLVSWEVEQQTGVKTTTSATSPPDDLYEIEFRSAIIDSAKFRTATGWTSSITIREGIRATVSMMKNSI